MPKQLSELLKRFNIVPNRMHEYELAFTHASYNSDVKTIHEDYERLEYVGDSVLSLVIADLSYAQFPNMGQGDLSRLRAHIVQGKSLAKKADHYQFYEYIQAGKSIKGQIKSSKKLLEDVFEAFLGAVYFDQGIEFTFDLVKKIFQKDIVNFKIEDLTDYKSQLQEEMQSEKRFVKYEVMEEKGRSQDKEFTIRVVFSDTNNKVILGTGIGKSKKAAEQMAAKNALEKKVK